MNLRGGNIIYYAPKVSKNYLYFHLRALINIAGVKLNPTPLQITILHLNTPKLHSTWFAIAKNF